MRTWLLRLVLLMAVAGNSALAGAVVTLDVAGTPRDVAAQSYWWFETNAQASIADVVATPSAAQFVQNGHDKTYRLTEDKRLWIRMDVQRPPDAPVQWAVIVPVSFLDSVTLYQNDGKGGFSAQKAGDRIAVSQWPERARYPTFRVNLAQGVQTLYLQIQSSTPVSVPVVMAKDSEANHYSQMGYLMLGILCGALLLLAVACGVQGYFYRDVVYTSYGAYVLLMLLAIACYSGVGAQFMWPESPWWADNSQGLMAAMTAGAAMFFVHNITGVAVYAPRWSLGLLLLSVLCVAFGLLFIVAPRSVGVAALALYVTTCAIFGMWAAYNCWNRGDRVGLWLMAAYAPLAVMAVLTLLRAVGVSSMQWIVQWGIVTALLFEVPLLMTALHMRTRERHNAQTREEAMSTHDALTGLLTAPIFEDRLRQCVMRARRHREDAAIVLLDLVNYSQIFKSHGAPVAEQSMLRAVIKLRRVLRDVDTACRVSESRFGLILEGIHTREAVTQTAARLIAMGLMPLKGLQPEVTLQFHVAAVVLREHIDDSDHLVEQISGVLNRMSRRTRRPIRFVEPLQSNPMALDGQDDSGLNPSSLDESSRRTEPAPLSPTLPHS